MKKIISLTFAIITFLSITSCSDDDTVADTTKPTVNIITPTDHQEVAPGTTLNFKAALADNVGLKSYKIEIHSADDGHEHKNKVVKTAEENFEYSIVKEVSNEAKDFEVNQEIDIPANVTEAHYHVGIIVIDVNGNQNQQFVEIFIGHEHEH